MDVGETRKLRGKCDEIRSNSIMVVRFVKKFSVCFFYIRERFLYKTNYMNCISCDLHQMHVGYKDVTANELQFSNHCKDNSKA